MVNSSVKVKILAEGSALAGGISSRDRVGRCHLQSMVRLPQRLLRVLSVISLLSIMGSTASAQDAGAGFPAYGTFNRDSIDTVNVGNLNLHFQFPLFAKKGKGLDFSADVVFDNTPYRPVVLQPATGAVSWQLTSLYNWEVSAQLTDQMISTVVSPSTPVCNNGSGNIIYHVYQGFVYVDQNHTSHSFPAVSVGYPSPCYVQTASGSSDGYFFQVTVNDAGTLTTEKLTDPSGNVRDFVAKTLTDPNGNVISGGFGGTFTWTDTTGTPVLHETATANSQTWNYPNPTSGGLDEPVTLTLSNFALQTNYACPNIPDLNVSAIALTTGISLPDGTSYAIVYESTSGTYPSNTVTGRIHSLKLPSGATITYTYSGGSNNKGINCQDGSPAILTKQTPDGTWTYNHYWSGGLWTTVVTDPFSNDTKYTFGSLPSTVVPTTNTYETQHIVYQGSVAANTPLETVLTCYNGNFTNCANSSNLQGNSAAALLRKDVYTSLAGSSQQSLSETFYMAGVPGLVSQDNEFDWGVNTGAAPSATPLRETMTMFAPLSGNILTRPSCIQITAGTSPTTCGTVTASTNAITKYLNYDAHGNVGAIQNWVSGTTYSSHSLTYYTNGLLHTDTDSKGAATTYTYGNCNSSYPTNIAKAGLSHSMVWDCNGGVLTSSTDANGQSTFYSHSDPFWRVTEVIYPDQGQVSTTYNDSATPANVTSSQLIDNLGHTVTIQTSVDGLGRPVQTSVTSDPENPTSGFTSYDNAGRVGRSYNPTRCDPPTSNCGEATWGFTSYAYDALDRPKTTTAQDGNVTSYSYSANCVTTTDPAAKSTMTCSDALGRITRVIEDPASSNFETDYSYDSLGNLKTVTQRGGSTISGNWRTRTFAYDGLSRLISALNPETGAVATTFVYDPNGNLQYKTSLAPNQAANGTTLVTMSYCYDSLDRLTAKGSGSTQQTCTGGSLPSPIATYTYDQGGSSANALGQRTSMTDQAGSETWTYDKMGRIVTQKRTTNGITMVTAYTYNMDGSVATVTYPSGRTITYITGSAGRTLSAIDQDNGINYASGARYAPSGAMSAMLLGQNVNFAGINVTDVYNSRLQPTSIRASSTAGVALDLSYCFGSVVSGICQTSSNNGNVSRIVNNKDTTRTQNFTYDGLNRISAAYTDGALWGETFQIDPWGNLNQIQSYPGKPQGENLSQMAGTNNRFVATTYDAAGNLLNDGGSSYTYDAENRILTAASVTYVYDGDGNRVGKSSGKLYWYGADGNVLDESDMSGNFTDEFVFFAHQRIARQMHPACPNPGSQFYLADHLGSSRIVADNAGNVLDDSDFYPFGGERQVSSTSGNTFKFTGKERDSSESNLDNFGARSYSSALARFMVPDPSGALFANPKNPQSWNLYSYALNNPLRLVDPTGLYCEYYGSTFGDENDVESTDATSSQGECEGTGGKWFDPIYQQIQVNATATSSAKTCDQLALSKPTNFVSTWWQALTTSSGASTENFSEGVDSAARMTTQFASGLGPSYNQFGPSSPESQNMAESPLVRQAIGDYLKNGVTAGTGDFEKYLAGPVAAGANPTAQFVGGFTYQISQAQNGDLNMRITNPTSLHSAAYHLIDSIPPDSSMPMFRVPMTTVTQNFDLVIACSAH